MLEVPASLGVSLASIECQPVQPNKSNGENMSNDLSPLDGGKLLFSASGDLVLHPRLSAKADS